MLSLPPRRSTRYARPALERLEDRAVPTAGWAFNVPSVARRVAADEAGGVYAAGGFGGTQDFDPGPGVTNLTAVGSSNVFVTKYAADGSLLWATRAGPGEPYAVAAGDGALYVGGEFSGMADFGPTQLSATSYNGFIAKLDAATGAFLWALPVSSAAGTRLTQLTIDVNGDVLATGRFNGTVDFDPSPAVDQLTAVGGDNTFVWKLDAGGNHLWVRSGTNGNNDGRGIDTDALGNVYVQGNGTATLGSFSVGSGFFLTKLDSAGNFLWAKTHPTETTQFEGMAVDDSDLDPANWGVYFTGYSDGSVFAEGLAIVKTKASDGTVAWERIVGGFAYAERLNASDSFDPDNVAVLPGGDVVAVGRFRQTVALDFDPGPGTAYLSGAAETTDGQVDLYLLRLNSNGEYVSARQMGGDSQERIQGLAVGADGMVYLSGNNGTSGSSFDVGQETVTLDYALGSGFLVKHDLTYGAVSGRVVHDANANGDGEDEAFGLAGWTVYLDQNNNHQLDADETSTTSNARGIYVLGHLPAGTYTVALVPKDGWVTAGSATTTLTGDGRFFQHTFANTTAPVIRTYAATNLPASSGGPNLSVTSSITIPQNLNILDLDVLISATHNKLPSLTISLRGPGDNTGREVRLKESYSLSGKNLTNTIYDSEAALSIDQGTAPYTGRFRLDPTPVTSVPDRSLEWWDGMLTAGTWTLMVDPFSNTTVTLTGFSLLITTAPDGPLPPPSVSINDVSLNEGNAGTQTATFTVSLSNASAQTVTVNYATADGTATTANNDYVAAGNVLTFMPGQTSKTISVTVNGDAAAEANEAFFVNLTGPSNATIGDAQGTGTILDDDSTKFFVVDDASADHTYRYGVQGNAQTNSTLGSGNTAPRGAASNTAGDRLWVVDANKTVYVYNAAGGLDGSWSAGGMASNAEVQGIAVDPNGADVWIVDNKQDKVFKYTGAATRLSGSQNAASSFNLASGNGQPRDVVTDGTSLWVVNDAANDKVFKYSLSGTLLGSWTITGGGGAPTGITLDPTDVGHLWVVDSATDRVYQYDDAASRASGSQNAATSFALAAGNTNPQGIADPPAPALSEAEAYPVSQQNLLTGDPGGQGRADLLAPLTYQSGHVPGIEHSPSVPHQTVKTATLLSTGDDGQEALVNARDWLYADYAWIAGLLDRLSRRG